MSITKKQPAPPRNDAVISYLQLRQFIGILGLVMPVVLLLGSYLIGGCPVLEPSISHYYYSIMHVVFVGMLCMIGSFLITYKGTSKNRFLENSVSNIAGFCAFCVAIFPTRFNEFVDSANCRYVQLLLNTTDGDLPKWDDILHHTFASILFVSFSVFCLKIFLEPDLGYIDEKKKRRNFLYKACGIVIIISMAAIATIAIFKKLSFQGSTFIFETTALMPFGLSWLVKGSVNWPASNSAILRKAISGLR